MSIILTPFQASLRKKVVPLARQACYQVDRVASLQGKIETAAQAALTHCKDIHGLVCAAKDAKHSGIKILAQAGKRGCSEQNLQKLAFIGEKVEEVREAFKDHWEHFPGNLRVLEKFIRAGGLSPFDLELLNKLYNQERANNRKYSEKARTKRKAKKEAEKKKKKEEEEKKAKEEAEKKVKEKAGQLYFFFPYLLLIFFVLFLCPFFVYFLKGFIEGLCVVFC